MLLANDAIFQPNAGAEPSRPFFILLRGSNSHYGVRADYVQLAVLLRFFYYICILVCRAAVTSGASYDDVVPNGLSSFEPGT